MRIRYFSGSLRAGLALGLAAILGLSAWMLFSPSVGRAACGAVEWTGAGGDHLWATAENWSTKAAPESSQAVCIGAGAGTITVAAKSTAHAKTLKTQSGLLIEGEGTLALAASGGLGEISEFAELTIATGGALSTIKSRVEFLGNTLVNGEVTGAGAGDETLFNDAAATLTGNGTIHPVFAGLAGTMSPGGVGTVGKLTFDSQLDPGGVNFKLVVDLESESKFDEIVAENSPEVQLSSAAIEGRPLGKYAPSKGAHWLFIKPGFCALCGEPTSGWGVHSALGGIDIERTSEPERGPQPPVVEATPGTTQAEFAIKPPADHGTGTIQHYTLTVEPGGGTHEVGSEGPSTPSHVTLTSLTNCTTYTATATVTTTVSTSAASAPVNFTPVPPAGCGSKGGGGSATGGSNGGGNTGNGSANGEGVPGPVASTPKAIEELALGCSGRKLVLNDVYIHGSRVVIAGSAAKSLVGKRVKILFNEGRTVATATVLANGEYATTAPLPPAKIRGAVSTRYTAVLGSLRSLHLKLTRRLQLEPPKASGHTVTLTGVVTPPLTKPAAPVIIEQQLECGKTTIAKRFPPPVSGRFHITLNVPANAKAGIYRLTSSVAANTRATGHGFATYSLPLPVVIG
jgi:hypothetical protein